MILKHIKQLLEEVLKEVTRDTLNLTRDQLDAIFYKVESLKQEIEKVYKHV